MNKILCYLLVINLLLSCNSVPPESNWDYTKVIGKTIQLVRIERAETLEIAEFDFPTPTNWVDAKKLCSNLGLGWRLPSKDELNYMYKNRDKIKGLKYENYWNGKEDMSTKYYGYANYQNLYNGGFGFQYQSVRAFVRAVKIKD
jgi:hypothetical protein